MDCLITGLQDSRLLTTIRHCYDESRFRKKSVVHSYLIPPDNLNKYIMFCIDNVIRCWATLSNNFLPVRVTSRSLFWLMLVGSTDRMPDFTSCLVWKPNGLFQRHIQWSSGKINCRTSVLIGISVIMIIDVSCLWLWGYDLRRGGRLI